MEGQCAGRLGKAGAAAAQGQIRSFKIVKLDAEAKGSKWSWPEELQIGFVDIAPAPIFAALGRLNQGMLRRVKVRARVAIRRRVAAAHMAALQAHAQVNPGMRRSSGIPRNPWCLALPSSGVGDMSAFCRHRNLRLFAVARCTPLDAVSPTLPTCWPTQSKVSLILTAFPRHAGHTQSEAGIAERGNGGRSPHQQPPILHSKLSPHSGQVLMRTLDAAALDGTMARKASTGPHQSNNSGWIMWANSSVPSTRRGPGRAKNEFASTANTRWSRTAGRSPQPGWLSK